MDRRDILEILFSSIKEDDPYRASKLLQIERFERWCYLNAGAMRIGRYIKGMVK